MKLSDLLLKVMKKMKFFRDKNDHSKFYAEFQNCDGVTEFAPLNSESVKDFVLSESCELTEDDDVLEPHGTMKIMRSLVSFHRKYEYVDVFIRTSGTLKDRIEYDLQNHKQKTVQVTREGWKLAHKMRKFVYSDTNLPQVVPQKTNESPLEILKPFVNITGDTFKLFVVWLIQAFSLGNHHILLIFTERGSGKSSLSKMIKKIVDPSNFDVTTIPEKFDDLRVLLNSTLLCAFDNVSSITTAQSDLFCGATTGTAIVKRSLYTDSEVNVSTLHSTIVINGIGITPERDDLAERMLILKLKKLKANELKLESDIWSKFEEELPKILGAIFNTLVNAMNEIDTIKAENLPRMADSFVEMLAIAKALGISEEEFRRIYNNNKAELEQIRLGSPIVTAMQEFMSTIPGRSITDTATNIHSAVLQNFSGDKKLLPNSASHFTNLLDKEHAALLKVKIRVNINDTGAKGTMITIIKKK